MSNEAEKEQLNKEFDELNKQVLQALARQWDIRSKLRELDGLEPIPPVDLKDVA